MLLGVHFLTRIFFSHSNIALDLYLYNSIALCVVATIFLGNFSENIGTKISICVGITLWTVGSTLSSALEFFHLPTFLGSITNICYLLLYPCLIFAIPKVLGASQKSHKFNLLDSLILGVAIASIGSALLIAPVLPRAWPNISSSFFAIFFPLGDLVLLSLVLTIIALRPISWHSALFSFGIVCYSLSDFLFLFLQTNHHYILGGIIDDGWLLGIVLISQSLLQKKVEKENKKISSPCLYRIFSYNYCNSSCNCCT